MINFEVSNEIEDIYIDMRKQFPAEELKSFSYFQELLKTGTYKFFKCSDNNTEVGYIICFIDEFILVDYLAVYKKYQSMGYGQKILRSLFEQHMDKKGVLFEVEKLDLNNISTIRRQKFYKNIGCINTGINYLFPSSNNPLPMDLLYYPLSELNPSKKDILNYIKYFFDIVHFDVKDRNAIYSKIY